MLKLYDVHAGYDGKKKAKVYWVWGLDRNDAASWFMNVCPWLAVHVVEEHKGDPAEVPWSMGRDRFTEAAQEKHIVSALNLIRASTTGFDMETAKLQELLREVLRANGMHDGKALDDAVDRLEGWTQRIVVDMYRALHDVAEKLFDYLDGEEPTEQEN